MLPEIWQAQREPWLAFIGKAFVRHTNAFEEKIPWNLIFALIFLIFNNLNLLKKFLLIKLIKKAPF